MPLPSGSQTVGPFFKFALDHPHWSDLTAAGPAGEKIRIVGRVLDGDGVPVPDALLEIRQADADGRYASDTRFLGFGRAATDPDGRYAFTTIRPGPVGTQAPHVVVSIFARGLLKQLVTRIYFADRAAENATDPLLATIGDPAVRGTLIAKRDDDASAIATYRFDVVLQGEGETAFIEL